MRERLIGGYFQSYHSLLSRHWSAQYLISSVKTNDRKDPDVSQGTICGHRDRERITQGLGEVTTGIEGLLVTRGRAAAHRTPRSWDINGVCANSS